MRRQDFELLSSTIRATRPPTDVENNTAALIRNAVIDLVAINLARALSSGNVKFDVKRFLTDSGVTLA